MREHRICEGCGGEAFALASSYAGRDGAGDVEILVWRCGGCGGEAEEAAPLSTEVDARPGLGRRVA
jgi:hypothetical protein